MSSRDNWLGMDLPAVLLRDSITQAKIPLRILVISPFSEIGLWVCDRLAKSGHTVKLENGDTNEFKLKTTNETSYSSIQDVFDKARPFIPKIIEKDLASNSAHDVIIELCRNSDSALNFRISSDSQLMLNDMRELAHSVSGTIQHAEHGYIEKNRIVISPNLEPFNYSIACWIAKAVLPNCRIDVHDVYENDELIWLSSSDSRLLRLPFKSRYPVVIESDDPDSASEMLHWLQAEGFQAKVNESFEIDPDSPPRIEVINGPFRGIYGSAITESVAAKLRGIAESKGIDNSRYPVRINPNVSDNSHLLVTIPMNACRGLTRRPWAGNYPERFRVQIVTDDPESPYVAKLAKGLSDIGFINEDTGRFNFIGKCEPISEVGKGDLFDVVPGMILAGDFDNQEELKKATLDLVWCCYKDLGAPIDCLPRINKVWNDEDFDLQIHFPVLGISDGSALKRMSDPVNFDLKIYCSDLKPWEPFIHELRSLGFDPNLVARDAGCKIEYGAAPEALVNSITDLARSMSGIELLPSKIWSHTDNDIAIGLPEFPAGFLTDIPKFPDDNQIEDLVDFDDDIGPPDDVPGTVARVGRSFVSLDGQDLLVGETRLRVRQGPPGAFTRPIGSMAHYCVDSITAATLGHLAKSIAAAEPCLLEGETSTSKTSSIEFLAAHLNQPVLRINLNGQTDTGDLLGRFVPQNLVDDLPLSIEELLRHEELLETESRIILRNAAENARNLTAVEIQQVMANEKMRTHPWRWQDGGIVQAMKHGYWVILDEVNLAEPQILERLNSLLEFQPSFVLTEYDNSRFGKGGARIHPDFRIFATMNPAEYAGRSAMSPAYKDRWRGYRLMEPVREQEYIAMLRRLVFGTQPELKINGIIYDGAESSPVYPNLRGIECIDLFLCSLARFHCSMESAAGQGGGPARIGARRKEKLVFTRRGLVSVIDFMDREAATGNANLRKLSAEAITRYYTAKVPPGEDLQAANSLLDACGIGESSWSVGR